MNRIRIIKALSILVICSVVLLGCSDNKDTPVQKADPNKEKAVQSRNLVNGFAANYKAVTDWNKKYDNLSRAFTFQLEDDFINGNKGPVLFIGEVKDITQKDNKYYVQIKNVIDITPEIYLLLELNQEQVAKITGQEDYSYGNFAVVAQIETLEKPQFGVSAYSNSNSQSYISIDDSDIIIAKGKCLGLMYAGDYSGE